MPVNGPGQHKYSPAPSLCLSILSLAPNYIISGLEIVNRNTLVNAIIVDRSLANSRLEKLPQMPVQNGRIQETKPEEDQHQTHGNINYCTVNVNSFNIHNITMEHCYNNIPVTRSSFFPLYFCPHSIT